MCQLRWNMVRGLMENYFMSYCHDNIILWLISTNIVYCTVILSSKYKITVSFVSQERYNNICTQNGIRDEAGVGGSRLNAHKLFVCDMAVHRYIYLYNKTRHVPKYNFDVIFLRMLYGPCCRTLVISMFDIILLLCVGAISSNYTRRYMVK